MEKAGEPLGMVNGKRTEHDLVNEMESRCGTADPHAQRKYDKYRNSRAFGQHAECNGQVPKHIPLGSYLFL